MEAALQHLGPRAEEDEERDCGGQEVKQSVLVGQRDGGSAQTMV